MILWHRGFGMPPRRRATPSATARDPRVAARLTNRRARRRAAGAAPWVRVAPAAPQDLPFLVALQRRHHRALGFLPRKALEEKIGLGQVLVARVAWAPAGFLHHGSLARPEVRVFQAAVAPGARRGHVGLALVHHLLRRACAAGARGVSLRCLQLLSEANRFWESAGFERLATEPGARGALNVWVKRLRADRETAGARFDFASRVHPCPACGKPTVDTWLRGARRLPLCPACAAARRRRPRGPRRPPHDHLGFSG